MIFDNGSGIFKGGVNEEDQPSVEFPTLVGKPINPMMMVGVDQKDFYVGNEVQSKKSLLEIVSPIEKCEIMNWDYMVQIWQHCFENELNIDITEHSLMVTEDHSNPLPKKEKTLEIFMENFGVENF